MKSRYSILKKLLLIIPVFLLNFTNVNAKFIHIKNQIGEFPDNGINKKIYISFYFNLNDSTIKNFTNELNNIQGVLTIAYDRPAIKEEFNALVDKEYYYLRFNYIKKVIGAGALNCYLNGDFRLCAKLVLKWHKISKYPALVNYINKVCNELNYG
ncbi:MAG TPA: hypothetical protein DIS94_02055 [Bacteroidetes bacterium]|nr:hypothetical protein [Bacteroidota bacterium]